MITWKKCNVDKSENLNVCKSMLKQIYKSWRIKAGANKG